MAKRHMVIDSPSGILVAFDPAALEHRLTADPKWMREPAEVAAEVEAGRVARVARDVRRMSFYVSEEAPADAGSAARLRVTSGTVFFGDLRQLPSRRWGRRRWNLWDWLLLPFVLALVPFFVWLAGFDRALLTTLIVVGVLTVVASALLTLIFFRRGAREFAPRTGTPPLDRPEQVLTLPPGEYALRVAEGRGEPVVHVWARTSAG